MQENIQHSPENIQLTEMLTLKKMADDGNPEAKKKYIEYMKVVADSGNAEAQFQYGKYLSNSGSSKNVEEAIFYLNKSADQNNVRALIALGEFYRTNKLFPDGMIVMCKDIDKAISYHTRAINLGSHNAMLALGIIYCKEETQDIGKALDLFIRAAQSTDEGIREAATRNIQIIRAAMQEANNEAQNINNQADNTMCK